jgi:hypothetical protein
VYTLERPVRFRSVSSRGPRQFLSAIVEKCSVKLVELRNIRVELVETARSQSDVSFRATLSNDTSEDVLGLAWMVWPEDGGADRLKGTVTLSRATTDLQFSAPREVLKQQRWLALAITQPFTTDGAQAARLPLET